MDENSTPDLSVKNENSFEHTENKPDNNSHSQNDVISPTVSHTAPKRFALVWFDMDSCVCNVTHLFDFSGKYENKQKLEENANFEDIFGTFIVISSDGMQDLFLFIVSSS
ncbi:hypothetical protein FQR65_LT11390 [Abscondita terminalis]|nr:hypothetical protein FQR65_LT11390 [Abscondita terminalis]